MSKIDYSLVKYDIFPLILSNRDNMLHVTECVLQLESSAVTTPPHLNIKSYRHSRNALVIHDYG